MSPAQTWQDFGTCKIRSAYAPVDYNRDMSGLGIALTSSIAKRDYVTGCMLSKGYRRLPSNLVTNSADYPK